MVDRPVRAVLVVAVGAAVNGSSDGTVSGPDDLLVQRLRDGDGATFREIVRRHHASMVRVAATFSSVGVAEDVVQETWVAVIRGIDAFESRSRLRTWIFAILVNRARARRIQDDNHRFRNVPLESPAVLPDRFTGPEGRGRWTTPLSAWHETPEIRYQSAEALREIANAIEMLHPHRRQVLVLRDVEGWTAREVCDLLGISEANQRVLLHRARAALRNQLEWEGRRA